jgi:hypothetical protein
MIKSRYAGGAGVCAVIMEEQPFAEGCRRSRGGLSIPWRVASCPCVLDARVRDSHRASWRGRAAPSGWYDCADHASSTRARGCDSCQKGLQRSRDRSCPHCVHPAHATPRQTAGATATEGRTAVGAENGRSAHARAIGPPGRGAQTTSPVATQLIGMRSGRQFLHPHAMCGVTKAEHGMPAVGVLPQFAGRQSCQIQRDRL